MLCLHMNICAYTSPNWNINFKVKCQRSRSPRANMSKIRNSNNLVNFCARESNKKLKCTPWSSANMILSFLSAMSYGLSAILYLTLKSSSPDFHGLITISQQRFKILITFLVHTYNIPMFILCTDIKVIGQRSRSQTSLFWFAIVVK